jgi:threonine synthase
MVTGGGSLATGLRCLRCNRTAPLNPSAYDCPHCRADGDASDPGIFDVEYDYERAGDAFRAALARGSVGDGIFRYRPLLPTDAPPVGLPVGGSALVPAPRLATRYGLRELWLKDETRNPTRCLKDRATAIGVSMAVAAGRRVLACASAGNAAISLAGFCASAGLECHAFVPAQASRTRLAWLRLFGARVRVSSGNYDQAFDECEREVAAHGWYSRNCALNPYLVEGKKTAAFEIVEQLGGAVPDLVVAPVGDGCTLGALGKGFRELRRCGITGAVPRLAGVQARAISPLVARWDAAAPGDEGRRRGPAGLATPTDPADDTGTTRAASIAVRRPRNGRRVLREVADSGGTMVAVGDEETAAAQRRLAHDAGVAAEFTSATTLAALDVLAASASLAGQVAVLVITGGRLDEADL